MPPASLILASTSVYRKAQLEQLGIPFTCKASHVDEDGFKSKISDPKDLAITLAKAKAEAVAANHREAIVIGGDQLVSLDGEILGKPHARENAIDQLLRMSGRSHQLLTAIAFASGDHCQTHLNRTTLTVRTLDHETAARYVDADQPLDCAGSYKIESRGIALFDRIESEDHTAIQGLPMLAVCRLLRDFGLAVP